MDDNSYDNYGWKPARNTQEITIDGEFLGHAQRVEKYQQKGWACIGRGGQVEATWLVDVGACVRRLCRVYGKTVPKEYRGKV
jgi:hypothetical protein